MPLIKPTDVRLVVIDVQSRLMPAIHDGARVIANAGRLTQAARMLSIPVVMTEQSPEKLGATAPELAQAGPVIAKTSFDSCAEPAFLEALAGDDDLVICGCEAHVCVAQTVLSLLEHRRSVFVVQDAVGSRAAESKEVAIRRMELHGAGIVTSEMVVFEWLRSAAHPHFRAVSTLIR